MGGWTLVLFLAGGSFQGSDGLPLPPEVKWAFLFAWLLGTALLYRFCMRLKYVEMDNDSLHVFDYGKEIRVPLHNVAGVRYNRFLNFHPVTITFHHTTEFGDSIGFMPEFLLLGFVRPHPVISELQDAVVRATGVAPKTPSA